MPTITTDILAIDYAETGSRASSVALLLHGWPDDRSTWDAVASSLNDAGLRTIVPSLRGYGAARFCVAGHAWGSNIAEASAVGWPDRVERLAVLASPPRLGGVATPPFEQTQRQWYHWFMATARGAQAVRDDPKGFAHLHSVNWSPPGWFDEATFERVAKSFENPDFVDVTLHSYRARWDEAEPDPSGRWLDDRVRTTKTLSVPTEYFQGAADGIKPVRQRGDREEVHGTLRARDPVRGRPFPATRGADGCRGEARGAHRVALTITTRERRVVRSGSDHPATSHRLRRRVA